MSDVPGGALALAANVVPLSAETSLATVSVARFTVTTVGVDWVMVAAPLVVEVAVVLTVWVPVLPLVTFPEGTVTLKVSCWPTTEPAGTAAPVMAAVRVMVAVLAPAFLAMPLVAITYGFPPTTMVLPGE